MALFRRKSIVDGVMNSIERNAVILSAPNDQALWQEAHRRMDHISDKAVGDEYNRLVYEKYRPRSFLERLLGR
jgi:hypothetical protein